MLLLKAFVFQNLTDLGQKGRHLVHDNVPQDVFVNAEVLMSHDVTKSGDASPLYVRITCLHLSRHMFGTFADDLQVAHDGTKGLFVIHETRQIHTLCVAQHLLCRHKHAIEVQPIIPGHESSPFRSQRGSEA